MRNLRIGIKRKVGNSRGEITGIRLSGGFRVNKAVRFADRLFRSFLQSGTEIVRLARRQINIDCFL